MPDKLPKTETRQQHGGENSPPIVRKEGAHIDEELWKKRNIFAGLFKQHRHLRHQVSHEQKDEPKTQEKKHRRINECGYDFFLEIIDGYQKSRLPLQQLG